MKAARVALIVPLGMIAAGTLRGEAEVVVNGRPAVVLENPAAKLVIDLGGGSIVDFHLANGGLNPLAWLGPGDENAALRPMAHFLCLDRWGPPSAAELRNGMPFHGETSRVRWQESASPDRPNSKISTEMGATLPLAGLQVRRRVQLSESGALFHVSETVTNTNKLGRVYNMVQHPTIGPPFLDESTVVDSNGDRGFAQSNPLPNPEQTETRWPQASNQGKPVDLRQLTTDPNPNVVSFVIEGDLGWVTATNAAKELLIGYVWQTSEYPWLNVWRHVKDGKPLARGLEFGTSGLHQPFTILATKPTIFGRPTFSYLDAGQSKTRSYAAFLIKVPRDFRGVARVLHRANQLVIQERGSSRELTIAAERLFP